MHLFLLLLQLNEHMKVPVFILTWWKIHLKRFELYESFKYSKVGDEKQNHWEFWGEKSKKV